MASNNEAKASRWVETVRSFGRFYTQRIGALESDFLDTPHTLPEARLLYEIAAREPTTVTELSSALHLDMGYVSRLVRGLVSRRLLTSRAPAEDRRVRRLALSSKGRRAFATLDEASRARVEEMLGEIPERARSRLAAAMRAIHDVLAGGDEARPPYLLRTHEPGDMGWVVELHGRVYAREYGWDSGFEALVAEIVARFLRAFDPARERCWIAEREGVNVGSVFLVRKSKKVAQLRLLLVDPAARGFGIGKRLVAECTRFARRAGYREIVLWTNDVLRAARHIYEAEGYRIVREERHRSFGHDLVGQYWALRL